MGVWSPAWVYIDMGVGHLHGGAIGFTPDTLEGFGLSNGKSCGTISGTRSRLQWPNVT